MASLSLSASISGTLRVVCWLLESLNIQFLYLHSIKLEAEFGMVKKMKYHIILMAISRQLKKVRIIMDVGAKGITAQTRSKGHTTTKGLGRIKEFDDVHIFKVFDEHAIIYNEDFSNKVAVGDKVQIIPNHICPVCNLYEKAYLVSEGEVVEEIPVECRAKLQ